MCCSVCVDILLEFTCLCSFRIKLCSWRSMYIFPVCRCLSIFYFHCFTCSVYGRQPEIKKNEWWNNLTYVWVASCTFYYTTECITITLLHSNVDRCYWRFSAVSTEHCDFATEQLFYHIKLTVHQTSKVCSTLDGVYQPEYVSGTRAAKFPLTTHTYFCDSRSPLRDFLLPLCSSQFFHTCSRLHSRSPDFWPVPLQCQYVSSNKLANWNSEQIFTARAAMLARY